MGGLIVAGIWGLLWAMFAAAAGLGLAVAAKTLLKRATDDDLDWIGGYNAMAPVVDR